ncbi:FHA domain-containing protein [bacterium]|nr:FHA domain-containing protein [bacterium]
MKITVKVFQDAQTLQTKTFDEGVFRIGRSEFSDIVLADDKISRSQVELRVNETAVYFTNMASPGSVKLNGRSKETGEIADGDELSVGPYLLLIGYGGEDEQPVPEPAAEMPAEEGAAPAEGLMEGFLPDGEAQEAAQGFGNAEPQPELESPAEPAGSFASIGAIDTDVEAKPVVAKLVFTEGPKKGEELTLEAYEVSFGRSKKADIFLDDEKLSRLHAKITRVGMGFRLIDLESHNGTFVNGMRVLEHPLASFDEIQLGSTKIRFLIHDVLAGLDKNQVGTSLMQTGAGVDQTESVMMGGALAPDQAFEVAAHGGDQLLEVPPVAEPMASSPMRNRRNQMLIGAVIGLLVVYLLLPNGERKTTVPGTEGVVADKAADVKIPPSMPKEYGELSEDLQRSIEGSYNSALKAADAQDWESAVGHLKSIHENLPYYKKSRELADKYAKKLKEKQVAVAQEKAKNDEKQDLAMYLQEGIEYLKEGDFERAGEAFNSAIVIDPSNAIAAKGLRAADAKVRDISQLPPEVDPEMEKKRAVLELFQRAVAALQQKQYQEAINNAEQARKVELKNDTQYLNEAKQIIDQARMLQKEEFEPFLISAKEKFAEGDYNGSRNLCEEMLKKDPSYEEASSCVLRARKNLNRLAKEAYTHGYILESMNRIEEAKQYWNRAKTYVRQGDEYYDKVVRKLDYYQ